MRTTLTLEPDVAATIERLVARQRRPLKQVVNDALRLGLRALESPTSHRPRRAAWTEPMSLGRCLLPELESVADALEVAEGPEYR